MFSLPDSWLWDFWLAEDSSADGTSTYHLFFLHASRALHDPDRRHLRAAVGHAVSTDLINWRQVPDALVHGDAPSFDQTATWTGSVTKGPDGRWFMFYTGTTRRPDDDVLVQQVGLAISDDLYHWVKYDGNPVLRADSRWYETAGGQNPWRDEHWRDPWVFPDPAGDGWHMLVTARANTGPLDDRGVVGHARSSDLLHWEAQPPLSQPGSGFGHLEVFQVANIDGQHVLIFNCLPDQYSAGRRETGVRGAIWAAAAKSALGPYDLAGAVPLVDERFYVGKLMQDPQGAWVMLAFENVGPDGAFVGALSDPMPVRWDGDSLVVEYADSGLDRPVRRLTEGWPAMAMSTGGDGGTQHNATVTLQEYSARWPLQYEREAVRIRAALGDRVLSLQHVGSTSVPGLAAKPVIDMCLGVADPADEQAYLPRLELAGYVLRIREPAWLEHRLLHGPDVEVNLHVFAADSAEIERMVRFRDRLRSDSADRELYARTKRELAARIWTSVQNYADAKAEVVEMILARAARRDAM